MKRFVPVLLVVLGASLAASQPATAQRIAACSLLPKEEVKKYLPWEDFLDVMPIEEQPVGSAGSSCNYPTVFLQVLPFSQNFLDQVRNLDDTEVVDGLGDEAYFHNNRDRYAELAVKSGDYILTLQASGNDSVEARKPAVLKLAAALLERIG